MKKYFIYIFILHLVTNCSKKEELIDGKIFENLTADNTGVHFNNTLTESHDLNYFTYSYLYMGGGVAAGDINNDGLIDLYFTGNQVSNKLYLNKGNLKFDDITEKAKASGDERWYTGVTMADVNSDGWLDIYCSVSGKFSPRNNQLFINNKNGTFTEQAKEYGIADVGSSIQSTFFDYDKDGDLDLFVANYPPAKFNAPNLFYSYKMGNHKPFETDHLYRNDGDFFTDVSKEAGVNKYGLSLSATIGDINNDSWPDIYVSNDFSTPDYMYINNTDGTFREIVKKATAHTAFYGMGVDIADFNNDGNLDFYQPDMDANTNRRQKANMVSMNPELFWSTVKSGFHYQYMQNSLQLNSGVNIDGNPYFTDISRMAGVSSTDWSWGGIFADFDNDGNKDLFVSNGTRREVSNHDYFAHLEGKREDFLQLSLHIPSEKIDNFMFKNSGDGSFEKANKKWNIEFKGFSTGATYADLDNDGDLEIVTNNLDDVASIFKNKSTVINNYIEVQFSGEEKNKFGIGNRVYVKIGDQTQLQELTLTRGFQSSVAPKLHFGVGKVSTIDEIEIVWTDGKIETLKDIEVNQTLNITYKNAHVLKISNTENPKQLFSSINNNILPNHLHTDNSYDDFKTQVLLPHKMSNFGPALAVGDLNMDGLDDYFIGESSGFSGALYYQLKEGFLRKDLGVFEKDKVSEDVGALIFDADNDGDNDLYVVSGGYEFSPQSEHLQDRLYINNGKGDFVKASKSVLPQMISSGSKVYATDFNKDGKKDILVLGRQIPENYPNAATSYLLKNVTENGVVKFENYSKKAALMLKNLGMATSAVLTDFNGDGWEDFFIVGEWMSIRLFKNIQGDFVEVSDQVGLSKDARGWWWSIAQGDFDNDGDVDYLVGNNGINYKYKAKEKETFDIYFNDFDKNGKNDIVLGYYNQGKQYPVRGRECSSQQIPSIKEKFPNYETYSQATLSEVYTKKELDTSLHYKVKSFASIYLENKNGTFTAHILPKEAQVSSVNQILVDDYNNDGNLDFLIAGNLFASEAETPRNDGSYGCFFKGDGKGGFTALKPSESGFFVPGDVKDMGEIKVGNFNYILAVKNKDYVQAIKIN